MHQQTRSDGTLLSLENRPHVSAGAIMSGWGTRIHALCPRSMQAARPQPPGAEEPHPLPQGSAPLAARTEKNTPDHGVSSFSCVSVPMAPRTWPHRTGKILVTTLYYTLARTLGLPRLLLLEGSWRPRSPKHSGSLRGLRLFRKTPSSLRGEGLGGRPRRWPLSRHKH